MEWRLASLRDERGNIPFDGLSSAHAHVEAMRAARDAAERAAGGMLPSIAGITSGAWTWIGPGNIGGRVRAVVVHPTTPSTIFAGSVSGGLWKSTNSGVSWAPVDDFMANLAVCTIIMMPGDPATMYAGTGEGYYAHDGIRGAGIFKSTNGGTTWTQLASTAIADFQYVNRLAASADGTVLLAATRAGLFRSVDAGTTWTKVLTPSSQSDAADVKFLPGSSTHAVASGFRRNVYYSSDAGATWQKSASFTDVPLGRGELGVSPIAPTTVFLALDTNNGELWKSTDSGVSYTHVGTPSHMAGFGWYVNALWVDPTNASNIVIGGQDLYRSTNGGLTFTKISSWPLAPNSAHADHHAIVSDPGYNGTTNRRVYFGNDGGVYKTEDVLTVTSASGGGFVELNNNFGVTQFFGVGGNASTGKIIGGTQDNGTLLYTPAGGTEGWVMTIGGDGGWSAADPVNSNYFYSEYVLLRLQRSSSGGAGVSYIYGGECCPTTIAECKPAPYRIDDACLGNAAGIAPFILDPNDPNRILAGGRSLWRTNDARATLTATTGPSWSPIKPPTAGTFPNSNISAVATVSGNPDVIWIGHTSGEVYVTTNGLSATPAWTKVNTGLPARQVQRIVIDPANPNVVYATFGGYSFPNIFKSTDGGASWRGIAGSGPGALPAAPMRTLVVHPNNSGWLYLGTEVGVFTSENGGASWNLPHDGPANVSVDELMWLGTKLVAATHGRGMFTVDVAQPPAPPGISTQPFSQAVFSGQPVTLSVGATGTGPFNYQWFFGTSPGTADPVSGATGSVYVTPPLIATAKYWVRVTNALGTAVSATATITVEAGRAAYDATLKVPRCTVVSNSCDSDTLLDGKGLMNGGNETHQPNTINDSCSDGSHGNYHFNESIDRLKVSTLDGTQLAPGKTVRIDATVYAFSNGDRVDLFATGSAATPVWSHVATLTPAAGLQTVSAHYVLPAGGLHAVRGLIRFSTIANTNPCLPFTVNDHDDLVFAVGPPSGSELVSNGDFSSGTSNWSLFEVPDIVHNAASDGVFRYHKADPTSTPSGQAVVFQNTGAALGEGTPLTARFDIGNTDTVRKRISVLILDADFSDLSVCTFWLGPDAPLSTYQMKTHPTRNWANASIYFYVASAGAGGDYLLDDVSLKVDSTASSVRTECVDPTAPATGAGAAGPNLLTNGDFSTGALLPWGAFFDLTHRISNGVFEFVRPGTPGVPAGGILQPTNQPMTPGEVMTATFQFGNSSQVRKRVTVLLHDSDFSDLSACTFWVAPGATLSSYAIRSYATKSWTNATMSIYAATTGADQWTRLDNAVFQRTPGSTPLGTECFEPGSAGPVPALGEVSERRPSRTSRPPSEPVAGWVGSPERGFVPADSGASAGGWRAGAAAAGKFVLGWPAPIDLTVAVNARLSFESLLSSRGSRAVVEVSLDGSTWQAVAELTPTATWITAVVDLQSFAGQKIYIRLVFDTVAPSPGVASDVWQIRDVHTSIERRRPPQ